MRHQVQWTAPPPFWGRSPDLSETGRTTLRRPALLRFATDAFMEEYNRTLESDPSKLVDLEAQYETWKGPLAADAAVPAAERQAPSLQQKLVRLRIAGERRLTRATATAVLDPPTAATGQTSAPPARLLKLYQPAHQRFYLVAASLVCRQPGLPDRAINVVGKERTTFVVRRVRTVNGAPVEYGFVPAPGGGSWLKVDDAEHALAPREETLPMFGVSFPDDTGRKRRVLAGLVPAGRREAYVGGGVATLAAPPSPPAGIESAGDDPGAPGPPVDPRIVLLTAEVIEPWKALVARAEKARQVIAEQSSVGSTQQRQSVNDRVRVDAREAIQVGSWYILLDFARFLKDHLNDVFVDLPRATTSLSGKPGDVWSALDRTALPTSVRTSLQAEAPAMTVKSSLREALAAIGEFATRLEQADGGFKRSAGPGPSWPTFLFPLADPGSVGGVAPPLNPRLPQNASATTIPLRKISALRDLIAEALPSRPTASVPDVPLAATPVLAPDETARFVIRCVFERPDCDPLDPVILSAPSREFELASFFDPDAPARPIRIALPVDTSPAGIRRAPKNTAFMVSDMLCGQIARAKGMGLVDLVRSVLPFPLHKALPDFPPAACKTDDQLSLGMICSLSIPIVTICALILLIIMVSILDYIFRWLPYFIFCFPLPKFSAKPPAPAQP